MSEAEIKALQKRNAELESALLAFASAYRLHKNDEVLVSTLKMRLAMNTSIEDWRRAFALMFGEEKVQEE